MKVCVTSLVMLGSVAVPLLSLPVQALEPSGDASPSLLAADSGCRQTNLATGIYTQPSLDSPSRGVLELNQTVRVQLAATGTGWARISEPVIGWVEARYLTPPSDCTGLVATPAPAAQSATTAPITELPQPNRSVERPLQPQVTVPTPAATSEPGPSTAITQLPTQTAQAIGAVCDVLPPEGLVVRSAPSLTDTALHTIPQGTHTFQFTGRIQTTPTAQGDRQWVYITSPFEGWISLGLVGNGFNLGGQQCG